MCVNTKKERKKERTRETVENYPGPQRTIINRAAAAAVPSIYPGMSELQKPGQ